MTDADPLRSYLATLTDEGLTRHLEARPDLMLGPPVRDLDDLAGRILHPSGLATSLATVPLPAVQVLEVLTASGAGASEARAVELLDPSSGGRGHADDVGRFVADLRDRFLVWPTHDDRLEVNPWVRVFLDTPLGLGRNVGALLDGITADTLKEIVRRWGGKVPTRKADLVEAVVTGLGDPGHVRRLVAAAPPEVGRHLHELAGYAARSAGARGLPAWSGPTGDTVGMYLRTPAEYRAQQTTAAWLREHGLGFSAWSTFARDVEIPAEVLLALFPAGATLPFDPQPPPLPRAAVTSTQAGSSAAGALTELLSAAMATLEAVSREPLAQIKSGGVGAREIKALAKRLGTDTGDIRMVLELAAPLGLLGQDRSGAIRTSPRFDQWREGAPADRAADLLLIWLGLDGAPTLDRDENDKSVPALTRVGDDPRARVVRGSVLGALAAAREEGSGIVSVDALAGYLAWQKPALLAGDAPPAVGHVWAEAERLGIAAHGVLSDIGQAVLDGAPEALITALTAALPAVQRTALFGSDLTVVVPGTPDAAVVDLLDATATRESRGSASTWRITADSVRRALDDGYAAGDLLDRLGDLADGALPQALDYLVRDIGRRYGHVRVRPAGAVLVSDDEALLAEIEVHRSLRRLGLRRVAPTVLVAISPPDDVVPALRSAGYLPRHLDADGDPVVRVGRRAPAADRVDGDEAWPFGELGTAPGLDDDDIDDLLVTDEVLDLWSEVREILHGEGGADGEQAPAPLRGPEPAAEVADRLVRGVLPPEHRTAPALRDEIAASARRLSGSEVRQLAHAVAEGEPVRIEYRSSSGGRSVRVVSGLELERGHLRGWCHLRDAERVFTVANILHVGPA